MTLKIALSRIDPFGSRTLAECHFCHEVITCEDARVVSAGPEDGDASDQFHAACFEFYATCLTEFVERVIRAAIVPGLLQ